MPTNVTVEYLKAEAKYRNAKTKDEKISALEEMISVAPKHKGMEHVLGGLKAKLSKLKKQEGQKISRKSIAVAKEGEAQIVIIGLPNSGKSTLLNKLTGSQAKVAKYPYTTTEPEIGMLDYNDVNLQIVEIPSTFTPDVISIARSADVVIGLIASEDDRKEIKNALGSFPKKIYWLNRNNDIENLKRKIWEYTGLVHVYTKMPGKKKDFPAITFHDKATVKDVANKVHKDFLKRFRFARIFGPSAKFDGQQVGLEHRLKDGDIVEIHLK